eukprot:TRINITY_DN11243_c0_g1_i1.p1 TRINITY_DN11243_c0_g1~~TRINITY_DN11243_c0_g1_i1.p1  ORF type:complete len:615 (-),score=119.29 TRINITY_DN11243_c0_g1_i1:37-1881(-)
MLPYRIITLTIITLLLIGQAQSDNATYSCLKFGECMDNIDQDNCQIGNGEYKSQNCSSQGFDVGVCCQPNVCVTSTQVACTVLGGEFFDDTLCDSGICATIEFTSCCTSDDVCKDVDQQQCVDEGGEWVDDRRCSADPCIGTIGACCLGDGCYEMPEEYCTGSWSSESDCESFCVIENDVPVDDTNSTGRCCNYAFCRETTVEECNGDNGIFSLDKTCDDSCFPDIGACLKYGACIDYQGSFACDTSGGTFILGGVCPDTPIGACLWQANASCLVTDTSKCNLVGGTYLGEGSDCPIEYGIPGACCVQGECFNMPENRCIGTYSDGECPEGICLDSTTQGACCVNIFCTTQFSKKFCKSQGIITGGSVFLENEQCPSTGICEGDHRNTITGIDFSLPSYVNLFNTEISIIDSVVSFEDIFSTDNTSSVFSSSSVTFSEVLISSSALGFTKSESQLGKLTSEGSGLIQLQSSVLNITGTLEFSEDTILDISIDSSINTAPIIVGGCANFGNGELSITLDDPILDQIDNGQNVELEIVQYECEDYTTFSQTKVVFNREGSCVNHEITYTKLQCLAILNPCSETEVEEVDKTNEISDETASVSPLFICSLVLLLVNL